MYLSYCMTALLLAGCGRGGTTWLGEQPGTGGEAGADETFFERFEAEASVNELTFEVQLVDDGFVACPADGVREGAECTSGGTAIRRILGRSPCEPPNDPLSSDNCKDLGGGVEFKDVTVPATASYDVTWWYHCGEDPLMPGRADGAGDTSCGGLDYETGEGTGCRPHLIDVNGVPVSTEIDGEAALYFHFPCYVTSWSVLHGATTRLALRAGANSIYIHAPPARTLNAADIDAMDVQALGQGVAPAPLWPQLVTPVLSGY